MLTFEGSYLGEDIIVLVCFLASYIRRRCWGIDHSTVTIFRQAAASSQHDPKRYDLCLKGGSGLWICKLLNQEVRLLVTWSPAEKERERLF